MKNANASQLCRPFLDVHQFATSKQLNFFTDASGVMGYGCFFDSRWALGQWNKTFLKTSQPSIKYLELFALCTGIFMWENINELRNTRIVIFCDNQAVVNMVNNTSSSCRNCMVLLRMLVLNNLQFNRRVFVKYVKSADNILADSLSRNKLDVFRAHASSNARRLPDIIPKKLLDATKCWY